MQHIAKEVASSLEEVPDKVEALIGELEAERKKGLSLERELSHKIAEGLPAQAEQVSRATAYLNELYSLSSLRNLFFGNVGGCVGETSALLLGVGAAYLMIRRIICWRIPVTYICTVALFTWILGGKGLFSGYPLFHILSGGLMLGAFFMATDMVTTPVTHWGRALFGIGCGVITVIIRILIARPSLFLILILARCSVK